jgi:hypothetical protein
MLTPRIAAVFVLALATASPARAADLDPLLPADTELYLTVNLRQIIDSPLFQKHLRPQVEKLLKDESGEAVQGVLKELGIDPFKDLDRVTVAAPSTKEADRGLVILTGKFDGAKLNQKGKEAAKNKPETFKLHAAPLGGGSKANIWEVVVQPQQETSLFVAVVSARTIVVSPGKDYVVDALKQDVNRAKGALKNKELAALIEKMDPRQSVSVALLGKALGIDHEAIPKAVTDAVGKVEAVGGGVTVSEDVKFELMIATPSSEAALRIQKEGDRALKLVTVGLALTEENQGLSLLLDVVKSIKITNRGRVVSVAARLPEDALEDFFKKDG